MPRESLSPSQFHRINGLAAQISHAGIESSALTETHIRSAGGDPANIELVRKSMEAVESQRKHADDPFAGL